MKKTLNHSFWICWKDLLDFTRSKMSVVMIILMPLFMMVMVGFIYTDSAPDLSETPIAITNLDDGLAGTAFYDNLVFMNNATGMMDLRPAENMDDIRSGIYEGELDGGILISQNFTEDITAGNQGHITIISDQSNPQLSVQVEMVLTMVVEQMGKNASMAWINATNNIPYNETLTIIEPYVVDVEELIEGDPSYFQFVAPGIMAMVVMMSLMTGLPHAISYEKDTGTLDGMLVAPIRRLSIILGKVLAQTTRGMLQGLIILFLAMILFGVTIYGNILLVLLVMFLSVFSFVGLGILITSFSDKEETASMMMMTLMFPMIFLGGVLFPIEQMPGFMQSISQFLPLTYASSALRKVMNLNAGVGDITNELIFLIAFGVIFLFIAVPMFKKAMNR